MSVNKELIEALNERFTGVFDEESALDVIEIYDDSSDLEDFIENIEFMSYLDDDDDLEDLWDIIRSHQ